MTHELSYTLQEFRSEQKELFNEDGTAFDRLSHKEPMTRMLRLINLLEAELPTKERVLKVLTDFSVQDPTSDTYEQRIVRDNDFDKIVDSLTRYPSLLTH